MVSSVRFSSIFARLYSLVSWSLDSLLVGECHQDHACRSFQLSRLLYLGPGIWNLESGLWTPVTLDLVTIVSHSKFKLLALHPTMSVSSSEKMAYSAAIGIGPWDSHRMPQESCRKNLVND